MKKLVIKICNIVINEKNQREQVINKLNKIIIISDRENTNHGRNGSSRNQENRNIEV